MPERERFGLVDNNMNNIKIFPGKQWILCLGVIIPQILKNYEIKNLKIEYTYSKLGKRKKYNESTDIDFTQYSRMLVYVSEIDELKNENKKLKKNWRILIKKLKILEQQL